MEIRVDRFFNSVDEPSSGPQHKAIFCPFGWSVISRKHESRHYLEHPSVTKGF
jgi:hypothetical protein